MFWLLDAQFLQKFKQTMYEGMKKKKDQTYMK